MAAQGSDGVTATLPGGAQKTSGGGTGDVPVVTMVVVLTSAPGFTEPDPSCSHTRAAGSSSAHPACPACPPREGSPFTFHVCSQVVAHFAQDEVDVLLGGDGVGRDIRGAVRGPCDCHLLPGQEEDHSAIAGGWIQQPHVVRAEREEGQGGDTWGLSCTPGPGKERDTTPVLR